jgi:uncharacterized membrane protein (DUF441 family)
MSIFLLSTDGSISVFVYLILKQSAISYFGPICHEEGISVHDKSNR